MFWLCLFSCGDKGLTTYNTSPEISIQSHGDGTVLSAGVTAFRAQASDANHQAEELLVRWFDNQIEVCSWETPNVSGESSCSIDLTPGTHEIHVEVQDIEQAGSRAEISVQVEAVEPDPETYGAPTITLIFPEDESTHEPGSLISFQAFISYDGAMESLFATWTSSIDGSLPIALDPAGLIAGNIVLSQGSHALSLLVSDPQGGVATASSTVHVESSDPVPIIEPIIFTPNPVYTNDFLSTSISASDPEESPLTLSAAWSVDGQPLNIDTAEEGELTVSLDGNMYFDKNQVISLEVVASNGVSQTAETVQLTVSNTPPTQPGVSFLQQDGSVILTAIEGVHDIQCAVDTPSSDDDGDMITYSVSWEESGAAWQGSMDTTTHTNDTIPAIETQVGQSFLCTVTPNDGESDGVFAQQQISVIEAQPFVTIDTLNYNGMTYYPLHLDQCTPFGGMCCSPTTTQEQMDAFCQLAGYTTAVNWIMQTLLSTNCYCWGGCTNNTWHSNCCSGQTDRNFITSVDCQ